MPVTDRNRFLRSFHRQLQDRPLSPEDPFYVPYLQGVAGDPIAHLALQIEWREVEGVYLLSGHPGCGKSTELQRLKYELERQECTVFLVDMNEFMNMSTPVEITDFFVSMIGALSSAVHQKYQRDPLEEGYWTRFKAFLQTRVNLQEVGVEGAGVSVTASLRNDPTFRHRVQEGLRGHVAALVKEAHEFVSGVVASIRDWEGDPDRKVVLLVDSLEKIRGVGANAESVYNSVRNLFSTHAESLRLPSLHVLYTLPPYLIPLAPGLGAQLGTGLQTIPSMHVFRDRTREPDPEGLALMRDVVGRRCAEWSKVFTESQLDRIALASGGDLREFLYLLSYCLLEAAAGNRPLPVPDDVVLAAENDIRRNMLPIAEDDRLWLRRIAETHEAQLPTITELPSLARFFDTKLVLNYRNGTDWYDVHPLLREVVADDGA